MLAYSRPAIASCERKSALRSVVHSNMCNVASLIGLYISFLSEKLRMGGGHFMQSSPMRVPTNVSNPIISALLYFKVIRSMVNNSPRPWTLTTMSSASTLHWPGSFRLESRCTPGMSALPP